MNSKQKDHMRPKPWKMPSFTEERALQLQLAESSDDVAVVNLYNPFIKGIIDYYKRHTELFIPEFLRTYTERPMSGSYRWSQVVSAHHIEEIEQSFVHSSHYQKVFGASRFLSYPDRFSIFLMWYIRRNLAMFIHREIQKKYMRLMDMLTTDDIKTTEGFDYSDEKEKNVTAIQLVTTKSIIYTEVGIDVMLNVKEFENILVHATTLSENKAQKELERFMVTTVIGVL